MPFADVDASVKEDVATIRENPFLPPDVEVSGWVYDTTSGWLRPIE